MSIELARTFDLSALPPAFYEDPFPYYHALRAYDPVLRLADGSYFLTRYADLAAVYRDTKTFSSDKQIEYGPKYGPDSLLYEHHTTSLVFNDPPLHTRVRRIIIGALSPKAVAALEPGLIAMVDRLLDDLAVKDDVDLIDDFASTIPIEVIGNLLGVPYGERAPLRGWSNAILSALEPAPSAAVLAAGNRSVEEFLAYLRVLVAGRRERPGDPERDVLTRLLRGEDDGTRLSEAELLHNCIFLLNAGHETTTNLIGNGLAALLDWPAQKQLLLEQPTLIASAVEEFLRFESSNQLGNRMTTAAATVGGVPIAARTPLTLCIGAANRDPAQFPEPDVLDVRRSPNRHLGFASGPHQCAGLHIARLEGRIGISRFLRRFPNYRLRAQPKRGGRARFRGFLSLPVHLS
ncbi:MAG TPA: cytochrome P450 [Candidatus Baltobacteraceae bacterium]|nr:cytochrome P450 [Candidatus Baltobacteraceae bacterium]